MKKMLLQTVYKRSKGRERMKYKKRSRKSAPTNHTAFVRTKSKK